MDYTNIKNVFCEYSIKLLSLLILVLFLIPQSFGASFIVSPTNKIVNQGQTFDLEIYLDPMGVSVAGAQLNIEYKGSILKINNIREGEFLKQTGSNTFFNGGAINNSLGKVVNIFDAILGPKGVSTPGKFVIINTTAIGSSGSSDISLSNVKISDQSSNEVPVSLINGSIMINSGPTSTFTPPPAPTTAFIQGIVKDSVNKMPLPGVTVSTNTNLSTMTNATGFYSFAVKAGAYDLTAKFEPTYYTNNTIKLSTIGNTVLVKDIELLKKPIGTITGMVTGSTIEGITVISPNGGENWKRGTTQTIRWTSTGSTGSNVKIELLKNGVASTIKSSTSNDGSTSWTISSSQTTGTIYKVRITSTSNSEYTDISNNDFTISK
ncbi:MAG: carboxypeptidase regulatory-like domain-containing protein [Candidatus Methanoperedens sp.]|nr:carboxypeptidase regulatory-like domain-containing protein [Candidatus Methanoperedens sp.]